MRLFIAVPLPQGAAGRVISVLAGLRALEWPVRWVRDSGLHLTLKFFGEVTAGRVEAINEDVLRYLTVRVEAIEEVLRQASRDTGPIELRLSRAGAFPDLRRPRIIRLEVTAEPALELLQDRVERASLAIGYPPEGRPFFPHVTLGRVREGERLPAGAAARLEGIHLDLPFSAGRVVLFESRQTRMGPEYTERLSQPLRAGAPA